MSYGISDVLYLCLSVAQRFICLLRLIALWICLIVSLQYSYCFYGTMEDRSLPLKYYLNKVLSISFHWCPLKLLFLFILYSECPFVLLFLSFASSLFPFVLFVPLGLLLPWLDALVLRLRWYLLSLRSHSTSLSLFTFIPGCAFLVEGLTFLSSELASHSPLYLFWFLCLALFLSFALAFSRGTAGLDLEFRTLIS